MYRTHAMDAVYLYEQRLGKENLVGRTYIHTSCRYMGTAVYRESCDDGDDVVDQVVGVS